MVSYPYAYMYDVYRVTTGRPGRGHILAATSLQLVMIVLLYNSVCVCVCVGGCVWVCEGACMCMSTKRATTERVIFFGVCLQGFYDGGWATAK